MKKEQMEEILNTLNEEGWTDYDVIIATDKVEKTESNSEEKDLIIRALKVLQGLECCSTRGLAVPVRCGNCPFKYAGARRWDYTVQHCHNALATEAAFLIRDLLKGEKDETEN